MVRATRKKLTDESLLSRNDILDDASLFMEEDNELLLDI